VDGGDGTNSSRQQDGLAGIDRILDGPGIVGAAIASGSEVEDRGDWVGPFERLR
jgi:hypothetical protein